MNQLEKLRSVPKKSRPFLDLGEQKLEFAQISSAFYRDAFERFPVIEQVYNGEIAEDEAVEEMRDFKVAALAYAAARMDTDKPSATVLSQIEAIIGDDEIVPEVARDLMFVEVINYSHAVGTPIGNFQKGKAAPANRQARRAAKARPTSQRTGGGKRQTSAS